ncbi:unnamed protein product, partial [Ectocarpus sp. 8 AP-2014]
RRGAGTGNVGKEGPSTRRRRREQRDAACSTCCEARTTRASQCRLQFAVHSVWMAVVTFVPFQRAADLCHHHPHHAGFSLTSSEVRSLLIACPIIADTKIKNPE